LALNRNNPYLTGIFSPKRALKNKFSKNEMILEGFSNCQK
jgi:hypothetical protein